MTADLTAVPRTGRPHEFFWIWHSAQFSFGTVVLGAVPVSYGLGWWPTVTAVLVGLAVGTAVFAPLVRISMCTGEGDAVSSSAHFGVRGRLLTAVITLLVSLVFFSIAVWTGASAVLVAGERLLGTPTDRGALAVMLPVVALGVVVVAVFGHTALMRTYRLLTVIGALVLVSLVAVLAGSFDPGLAGGEPALGGFWPTWLLAAAFAAALPVSYSTLQGDYGARLAPGTPAGGAMAWTGGSMFTSNAIALLVGAMVTTVLADSSGSWIVGLAGVVPGWFVAVVVVFGVIGTVPQAALCLYAAGLSAQSLWPGSSRAGMTGLVAAVGLAVLYLGAVALDAIDSISAAVPVLLVLISPWAAIMLVGHAVRGGRYHVADLTRTDAASRYRFRSGVNLAAFVAFVPAVVAGLLLLDNPLVHGPLAGVAGGLDLSWAVPFVLAGVVFGLLRGGLPASADGRVAAEAAP